MVVMLCNVIRSKWCDIQIIPQYRDNYHHDSVIYH